MKRGLVFLVGAGPGDPGLITVRGLELVRRADVVVHDRLVAPELLGEVRDDAELIDAGKAPGQHRYCQAWINALLIDRAQRGMSVVRLKGGDSFVFGRGFEELQACEDAGVSCVVVPGVTSAVAAPAAAGIPITKRGVVRSVAIVTGHTAKVDGHKSKTAGHVVVDSAAPDLDFPALAAMDTVVILMGRANLHDLARSLIRAGRDPSTPAACIERATTPRQRATKATLETIADAADRDELRSPVVTVIGDVASHARENVVRLVGDAEQSWADLSEQTFIPRAV